MKSHLSCSSRGFQAICSTTSHVPRAPSAMRTSSPTTSRVGDGLRSRRTELGHCSNDDLRVITVLGLDSQYSHSLPPPQNSNTSNKLQAISRTSMQGLDRAYVRNHPSAGLYACWLQDSASHNTCVHLYRGMIAQIYPALRYRRCSSHR